MSTEHDATEFVDDDFQPAHSAAPAATPAWTANPTTYNAAPTRAEVETQVNETQAKLAELKRQQDELERQRAALEELRRRQAEYQSGREEMLDSLTRGIGVLEEHSLSAQREADMSVKVLAEFKTALDKVKALNDKTWTKDDLNLELTRALTTIENARMEWNSARVKLPVLNGDVAAPAATTEAKPTAFGGMGFLQLCKLGFAFTWPWLIVTAIGFALILARLPHK